MGEAIGVSGISQDQSPGMFSGLMKALGSKTDTLGMISDTVGQRLNPTRSNVFGGLGTSMAKSSMAQKKIAEGEEGYKSMLSKVLEDLTSGSDMNKVGMMRDPATGEIKLDTQTKIPKKLDEVKPIKEKSLDASSAIEQSKSTGNMQDLFKKFTQ